MAEDEMKIINRIQETIRGADKIPASEVRAWLRHPSLDVLSVATDLILEHSRRIEPPLTMQEICEAIRDYYRRCLQENVQSEFVPSKHIAGYELVRWFISLWNDADVPREYLGDLKTMLAELYKSARDQRTADSLVHAVIEHLFEMPEIAQFFADWKSDPALSKAFAHAMLWVDGGGTSPLTSRPPRK